jgi:ABC-type antimicrobial peptide transport system permease subunit
VLLARATPEQTEIDLIIAGVYERLPGFPDGADAVMHIDLHTAAVPTKHPDFFLASTSDGTGATLDAAVADLRAGAGAAGALQIDTRSNTLDRDQSSLAALNIAGLVDLDSAFSLAMATAAIAIFVFGLLLQRRREYIVLRAQGLGPGTIRALIGVEAATAAVAGIVAGLLVGAAMGYYFVAVLRPLFVLDPAYRLPVTAVMPPVLLVVTATIVSSLAGSRMVATLQPTELLRDE